ncbi:MAG: 3-hydroxybutyrate oligomer hydrolase family protein [Rudaea sp.]|nr:3-hydroxybutyrate oligomer hydrolase family protein [Rudaea sp.]
MAIEFLTSPLRETVHRGNDDLLTAGLGLAGLRGAPSAFANAAAPTPAELRRRAIQVSWKGIADLGPLGRYGDLYGSAAGVGGREYQAFAEVAGARSPHRVLVQVPDTFDARARCLVVTASSGSRGIYGAIALAGAWGLSHGCAVAYTDKGTGSGYFDTASATGIALDGTPARAGDADLEFTPVGYSAAAGIATKHAHSGDNPEADWGRHVLQAAEFGLAMLDRAHPQAAPFTPRNTRILAVGVSNAGGAVLQAAGLDHDGMLGGVIALAPNVHVPGHGRALYDYATEAALLMPCALTDARFDMIPFARMQGRIAPLGTARCATLAATDVLNCVGPRAQAAEALQRLHAGGWSDAAIATAASNTAFDLWRAIAATYASAYARSGVGDMPCGFRFYAHDTAGKARAPTTAERAAWWADASGVPPGAGVFLDETATADPSDPTLRGERCLRALWTDSAPQAQRLRQSVQATQAALPRMDLPIWLMHGEEDGLLPAAFSSAAYAAWLHDNGRRIWYWPVPHAQHFDAFLALPGYGERYVPLLPFGYVAMDRMWRHLVDGAPLKPGPTPAATPRGSNALNAARLGLQP